MPKPENKIVKLLIFLFVIVCLSVAITLVFVYKNKRIIMEANQNANIENLEATTYSGGEK